jgi:Domain of unknown function (DUF4468) with TBP-like fold
MKRFLFVIFCSIYTSSYSQTDGEMPIVGGKYTFTDVVKIDSVNKNELFLRARSYINKSTTSMKDITQIMDKETGEIAIKLNTGNLPSKKFGFYSIGCGKVWMTVDIYIKDGKYKYVITNFIHEKTHPNQNSIGNLESKKACSMPLKEIKIQTNDIVEDFIDGLINAMMIRSIEDF